LYTVPVIMLFAGIGLLIYGWKTPQYDESNQLASKSKKTIKKVPSSNSLKVIELYNQGYSYGEISDMLKINIASVRLIVMRYIKENKS
jgi:DNA-directed RNA polymerase specialized sigma24 family protein